MMCNLHWMNNQYGYIWIGSRRLCLVDVGMNIVCWVVVRMVGWVLVQSYRVCAVNERVIIIWKYGISMTYFQIIIALSLTTHTLELWTNTHPTILTTTLHTIFIPQSTRHSLLLPIQIVPYWLFIQCILHIIFILKLFIFTATCTSDSTQKIKHTLLL